MEIRDKSVVKQDKECLTVKAPAKINLSLIVKNKRADGYHEIESLMQKIELHDLIHLQTGRAGIRLSCPGTGLPLDEGNLAYRAAASFFDSVNLPHDVGIDIILEKKIPVAAGLGGGSSDAAAVLSGLNILFSANLNNEELLALAKPLGADVSFFIYEWSAAFATGIGNELTEAASLTNCCILLVNPGFAVSTKWVYENFALTSAGNTFILARGQESQAERFLRRPIVLGDLHNDLETVTIPHFSELELIKEKLVLGGAEGVLMSGSGPTVFGLFTDERPASQSFDSFVTEYGKSVFLTKPYQADMRS